MSDRYVVRTVGASPRWLTKRAALAGWSLDPARATRFHSFDAAARAADYFGGTLIVEPYRPLP